MKRTTKAQEALLENAWDRFWFTPSSPYPLAWLRIGTGVLVLIWLVSWTMSITTWFGPTGWLPRPLAAEILVEQVAADYHPSPLWLIDAPPALWSFSGLACVAAAMFTLGIATRLFGLLTLVGFLSLVHRAPWLATSLETWLAMLLLYLNLGPCGAVLSGDARWFGSTAAKSWSATLSRRLIQLHSAALVLAALVSLSQAETLPQGIEWSAQLWPCLAGCVGLASWWLPASGAIGVTGHPLNFSSQD